MLPGMRFSVLASGSRGNSTYFEADQTSILIDCGVSARAVLQRLDNVGLSSQGLSAIIVTHEHIDHIAGVSVLSRRLKVPVYATEATAQFIDNVYQLEIFNPNEEFCVDRLRIKPFQVLHDAVDPVGFSILADGLKYTHVTDCGEATDKVRSNLFGSNAIVLEANHDIEMLQCCHYPWSVKQRIASSYGHLSNVAAAALLGEALHIDLNCILLAHLSENSNNQQLAYRTIFNYLEPLGYSGVLACAEQARATVLMDVGVVDSPGFQCVSGI